MYICVYVSYNSVQMYSILKRLRLYRLLHAISLHISTVSLLTTAGFSVNQLLLCSMQTHLCSCRVDVFYLKGSSIVVVVIDKRNESHKN